MTSRKSRVRARLLILLWIWAATVFVVVDLFLDVDAFDGFRPRSSLYRGMRVAAHRMVGEPVAGRGTRYWTQPVVATRAQRLRALLGELALVRELAREHDHAQLHAYAVGGRFAQTRVAALRALTDVLGERARPALLAQARDADEVDYVRGEAAALIGRTGQGASDTLKALIQTDLPPEVARAARNAIRTP
jgi:hypothetical protein